MTSIRDVNNDCIGLAFYGIDTASKGAKALYEAVITWFEAVQRPPDRLSVQGKGFSGKPTGFSNANVRLMRQDFSEIKAITVYATLADAQIPMLDWWAIAGIDLGLGLRPYFALAARCSVSTLDDQPLCQLIRSCIVNLCPQYGIGYHRSHEQGPLFYAAGVNYASSGGQESPSAYDEALTVSRWGDLGMVEEVYKQGILRDVYPHNYLSEPQLKKQIGEQTLKEWISSDASRGTLASVDDRMMLWKVAAPQIKHIRKELWNAGIIFNWKSYL